MSAIDLAILIDALQGITNQWYYLGLYLQLKPSELNSIETRNHGEAEECVIAALKLWLDKYSSASWSDVIDALDSIERSDISSEIELKHLANKVPLITTLVSRVDDLKDFSDIWYDLGLHLKIGRKELDEIDSKDIQCHHKMRAMLVLWLHNRSSGGGWTEMARALGEAKRGVIAMKIEHTHYKLAGGYNRYNKSHETSRNGHELHSVTWPAFVTDRCRSIVVEHELIERVKALDGSYSNLYYNVVSCIQQRVTSHRVDLAGVAYFCCKQLSIQYNPVSNVDELFDIICPRLHYLSYGVFKNVDSLYLESSLKKEIEGYEEQQRQFVTSLRVTDFIKALEGEQHQVASAGSDARIVVKLGKYISMYCVIQQLITYLFPHNRNITSSIRFD